MLLAVLTAALAVAPPSTQDLFKAHFVRAEAFYSEGELGAALWHFRRAEALRATPEVAYNLARCHEQLGDAAYAAYYYRLYLRRAPGAKDALVVAEKIGGAVVAVPSAGWLDLEAPGALEVRVDQRAHVEPAVVALALAPGTHQVSVRFPSGERQYQLDVVAGKAYRLPFEAVEPPVFAAPPEPLVVAGAPRSSVLVPSTSVPAPRTELFRDGLGPEEKVATLKAVSYALWGASAVALVGGLVVGNSARADARRLQEAPPASMTVSEGQALAGVASAKGATANVLFVASPVSALAGAVTYLLAATSDDGKRGAP